VTVPGGLSLAIRLKEPEALELTLRVELSVKLENKLT
jgi:hypothetical protein